MLFALTEQCAGLNAWVSSGKPVLLMRHEASLARPVGESGICGAIVGFVPNGGDTHWRPLTDLVLSYMQQLTRIAYEDINDPYNDQGDTTIQKVIVVFEGSSGKADGLEKKYRPSQGWMRLILLGRTFDTTL
jgi:hypothetical protein